MHLVVVYFVTTIPRLCILEIQSLSYIFFLYNLYVFRIKFLLFIISNLALNKLALIYIT